MARVFVSIGSNLGNRRYHVDFAEKHLSDLPKTRLLGVSPVYETDPVGPIGQDKFLNAVAELESDLDPHDLLDHLNQIEQTAGRAELSQRLKWGPRTLDLDILLYGDRVISTDNLIVPHPLMHERWFVLKPLSDLSPATVHPLLEMTVGELLHYIEDPDNTEQHFLERD